MAERTWLFQPDMVHAVRYLKSGRRLSVSTVLLSSARARPVFAIEVEVVDTSICSSARLNEWELSNRLTFERALAWRRSTEPSSA